MKVGVDAVADVSAGVEPVERENLRNVLRGDAVGFGAEDGFGQPKAGAVGFGKSGDGQGRSDGRQGGAVRGFRFDKAAAGRPNLAAGARCGEHASFKLVPMQGGHRLTAVWQEGVGWLRMEDADVPWRIQDDMGRKTMTPARGGAAKAGERHFGVDQSVPVITLKRSVVCRAHDDAACRPQGDPGVATVEIVRLKALDDALERHELEVAVSVKNLVAGNRYRPGGRTVFQEFRVPHEGEAPLFGVDGHVSADADEVAGGPGDAVGQLVFKEHSACLVMEGNYSRDICEDRAGQVERHGAVRRLGRHGQRLGDRPQTVVSVGGQKRRRAETEN